MEYALKKIKTGQILSTIYHSQDEAISAKKLRENGIKYKIIKRENKNFEWRGFKEWLKQIVVLFGTLIKKI